MNIYVFEEIEQASDGYHEGGGLVVIARSRKHARELIDSEPYVVVNDDDWNDVHMYPTFSTVEPRAFVFPDAGCC